jgi:hypothetical protein
VNLREKENQGACNEPFAGRRLCDKKKDGYSNERIHLFLATDLVRVAQNLDRDERLEVHDMPVQKVKKMIAGGEIEDGKTICALYMLLGFLGERPILSSRALRSA